SIVGAFECIEPQVSNLFKRETLSGDFLQINRYLVLELKKLGLWNEGMRNRLKMSDGSIQNISEIPEEVRAIYRTVWEIPMRSLIDMAAERGAFIDQSQSLNLFVHSPNIGKLSSMYMYAWKKGLKTTYYLRSRPATEIAKTTIPVSATQSVSCSLENPATCDSCQQRNCKKGLHMIPDPGFDLSLRPMKYAVFYDQYKAAIKNTWTVEEV